MTYKNAFLVIFFIYMGFLLQINANPTKRLEKLRIKALVGSKTLSMKLNLAKVQLKTTGIFFETIMFPSVTFCSGIFGEKLRESVRQRKTKTFHSLFFNKRWAGVPRKLPTEQLMTRVFENDFLRLSGSYKSNRKGISIYYSNGCHHVLCHMWDVSRLWICPTLVNAYFVLPR